jgi:arylsulfatase A-like enzyme
MLNSAAVRHLRTLLLAGAPLLIGALLLPLTACRAREAAPPSAPWERVDLWSKPAEMEMSPSEALGAPPVVARMSFLGAEEVRDMRFVPPQQLLAFPRRTAGQVRALEQMAGSRFHWRVRVGPEAYLSFIPLGSPSGCACTYRAGVRDAGKVEELYRFAAEPMGPIAHAAVELDLSKYAGRDVELLLQVDGPAPLPQPVPTVLWGSPALFFRQDETRPARREGKPNVLFIGLDTLRADAVGAWGKEPSLTPAMDRLAEESDVWLEAYSTFNVTNPSFVSMMTGLYGKNHGVYDLQTPLPQSHVTLAEHLKKAGYQTLAVIAARHLGDHNSGLGQGFDQVVRADEHYAGELAVDTALEWIGPRLAAPKPFFAWVHLFDPHTPHTPPQPYALGFRPSAPRGLLPVRTWVPFRQPGPRAFTEPVLGGERALYDGEVAYLDRQVGRLLDFLESRGALDDTLVVLVADHGESLGEHGIVFRHVGLHDTTTHVPMMIRWPRGEQQERQGRRIEGLVQTIDLFPTILGAVGLPVPPQDGEDLRTLTGDGGDGKKGRRAVFAEHAAKLGLMARTREHKYILSQGNPQFFPDGPSLYDVKADPGETRNLAGQNLPAERQMSDLLFRWLADRSHHTETTPKDLSPEEIERLRALGYIQ